VSLVDVCWLLAKSVIGKEIVSGRFGHISDSEISILSVRFL
jgi:hypothetical protein